MTRIIGTSLSNERAAHSYPKLYDWVVSSEAYKLIEGQLQSGWSLRVKTSNGRSTIWVVPDPNDVTGEVKIGTVTASQYGF